MITHTLAIFILPLILLSAGGLTVLLWLLPREYLSYGFFFAPTVGLTVFASLGLFEIGVLLIPLRPLILSLCIGLTFVVTAWLRREHLALLLHGLKTNILFVLLPVTLLIVIATGTREYGLSFLSAGQDEIQYVNNSLQILQHQHTGDPLDTVVPRVDHWPRDFTTNDLSYRQTYRRGAEIFLAGVMGVAGEDPFVSFTAAGIVAFTCFLLVLPAICHAFLGLDRFYSIFTQTLLGFSCLWVMLLFQGSLANLCSLSLFCLAGTAVAQLNSNRRFAGNVLAGLLLAGPVIYYNEVALAVLLAPLGLLLVISCLKSKAYLIVSLVNLPVTIASLVLFSHIALVGLVSMSLGLIMQTVATESTASASYSVTGTAGLLGPIFGIYTHYSTSFINYWFSQLAASVPWAVIGPIGFLHLVAAWGLFRKKLPGSYFLGVALIALTTVTFHAIRTSEPFLIVRSQQYIFSYIAIGIALATSLVKSRWIKSTLFIVIASLFGVNISTLLSTVQHLSNYDERLDPVILRYSPRAELWIQLLKQAQSQGDTPVLITGYDSTAKPLLIASLIEPHPSYFGASLRNLWKAMAPPGSKAHFDGNVYGVHDSILSVRDRPFPDLAKAIVDMDAKSQLAIVMVGSDDPEEWGEDRLIARSRKRFSPLGDIIERQHWSPLQLEVDGVAVPAQTSGIKHIDETVNIRLEKSFGEKVGEFEIVFDSNIKEEDIAFDPASKNDVQISFKGKILRGRLVGRNRQAFPFTIKRTGGLGLEHVRLVEVY